MDIFIKIVKITTGTFRVFYNEVHTKEEVEKVKGAWRRVDGSRGLCRATGEGFHGFIYNSYIKILLNSST